MASIRRFQREAEQRRTRQVGTSVVTGKPSIKSFEVGGELEYANVLYFFFDLRSPGSVHVPVVPTCVCTRS